jgi:hypothetical protein
VLRHLEVLSCVSGGSIVGACYWLALRRLLQGPTTLAHDAYTRLVTDLIEHFRSAVVLDLRREVQPSKFRIVWRFLKDEKGGSIFIPWWR